MATETKYTSNREGGDISARRRYAQVTALTMAAGATTSGSVSIPAGSWPIALRLETATAFTGSPTNINFRAGNTAAGQQLVADVDVKAQGHINATIVAAYDTIGNTDTTIYYQIAAVGGTNPAGTVNVILEYYPPVL